MGLNPFYRRGVPPNNAVCVQVGYLLGLGDRHPSNLMLDRYSGKLLHIDFGDCFEASMHREKFPEKVLLPSLATSRVTADL